MLRQKSYVNQPNLASHPENNDQTYGTILGKNDFVIGAGEGNIVMPPLSGELHFQEHLLLSRIPSPCGHLFPASAAVKLVPKSLVFRDGGTESERLRITIVGHRVRPVEAHHSND